MYGRTQTYHSEGENKNPLTELDQNGKRLRKQISESSGTEWKRYAPPETHGKRGTMNKIVYENMKTEVITTQQLLERETFFEDPRRAARLRVLERQALVPRGKAPQGLTSTAQRKRRRTSRRDKDGTSSKMANRDPCGNLSTGQNSEGFLPPTGWSWTRPGLYSVAAPLTPAPRAGPTGNPTGPGLPNGDATGDDD